MQTNTPPPASSIQCREISVQFPHGPLAVDNVDLIAPAGEVLSLIGPSGCGKTTLLRLMAALTAPTSGQVELDPPAHRRGETAFVFQQPALLPWRTAEENVSLALELAERGTPPERLEIAREMLHTVGLSEALTQFPHELSGGMRMRVSIARALVTQPTILLLDEPFAALDDMLRIQLGQLLLELWDQRRFTAVMVTHNIAESILVSHRIAVMQEGRVTELIENPLLWPRNETLKSTPEFGRFYGKVSQSLHETAGSQAGHSA